MSTTRPRPFADPRDDSPGPDDPAGATGSGVVAPGRVALLALMALVALGVAAWWRGRPSAPEMSGRLIPCDAAWRVAAFDPAANRLFGADALGALDRLDLASGRVEHWGRPGPMVRALALGPRGETLATGGEDGSVALRDAATGAERWRVAGAGPAGSAIRSLACRPDGRVLAVGTADGTIRLLDAADGRTLGEVAGRGGWVTGLAFGPTGRLLVSASDDGTVRLADGATGVTGRTIQAARVAIRHLALSPDGRTLALSLMPEFGHLVGRLLVLDLEAADAPARVLGEAEQDALAISADGRTLVSAGLNREVRQWDLASGQLVAVGPGHQGFINQVVLRPDARQAITLGEDRLIGLFDLQAPDASS